MTVIEVTPESVARMTDAEVDEAWEAIHQAVHATQAGVHWVTAGEAALMKRHQQLHPELWEDGPMSPEEEREAMRIDADKVCPPVTEQLHAAELRIGRQGLQELSGMRLDRFLRPFLFIRTFHLG